MITLRLVGVKISQSKSNQKSEILIRSSELASFLLNFCTFTQKGSCTFKTLLKVYLQSARSRRKIAAVPRSVFWMKFKNFFQWHREHEKGTTNTLESYHFYYWILLKRKINSKHEYFLNVMVCTVPRRMRTFTRWYPLW